MTTCRACLGTDLYMFLPLGNHPPANAFLTTAQLGEPEAAFPLECTACLVCGAIVVADQLPPDFFDDYVYVPSASDTMRTHFRAFAERLATVTGGRGLVVDIGCNDGLLLRACADLGLASVGIEPAANIADLARATGVHVVNAYFNPLVASRVRAEHGPANVITTTNTLNHINDLHSFMRSVDLLLADDGIFIVEVPQAIEFVAKNEFDTVYHEHLSTFSVTSLAKLFGFFGMRIEDVEVLPIHGGSMRVSARRRSDAASEEPQVAAWLERERSAGLFDRATYDAFAERVRGIRANLLEMLQGLRAEGSRIAGYGAPAKGNTLLNYVGIGPELLEFLADRNVLKQGTFSPGMRIPVVPPERVLESMPDYLLILAWNFADEIIEQQTSYRKGGGRFILPIPQPQIVG